MNYEMKCSNGCGATTHTGTPQAQTWRCFRVSFGPHQPNSTVTLCGPCAQQTTAEQTHQLAVADSHAHAAEQVIREAMAAITAEEMP